MAQTRNLCAQLPLDLHAKVCEARERSGLTTAQYITSLLTEYYAMKENGGKEVKVIHQPMKILTEEQLDVFLTAIKADEADHQRHPAVLR
jgi:hypothetical protein